MQSVEQSSTGRRLSGLQYVLIFLFLRICGMALVTFAIPLTIAPTRFIDHLDGPQQFGMSIMAYGVGFMAALLYLAVATVAHFIVGKRSLRTKFWVEGLVLCGFIFWVVYGNL